MEIGIIWLSIFDILMKLISYVPCSIPLEPLFMEGSLPPTAYNVVKNEEFRGEIRVALTFTPEVILFFLWLLLNQHHNL
jgi:hypothetical protein